MATVGFKGLKSLRFALIDRWLTTHARHSLSSRPFFTPVKAPCKDHV